MLRDKKLMVRSQKIIESPIRSMLRYAVLPKVAQQGKLLPMATHHHSTFSGKLVNSINEVYPS